MNWLIAWANRRRDSRLWGWLATLVGPEYKTANDLKQAVRCTRLEFSRSELDACSYIAFHFETTWGIESDHGFCVLYHPEKEIFSGTADAVWDV
jgi:hypothetical protein